MTTPYPGNANWPSTWQPCTIHGKFIGLDGTPIANGKLSLDAPVRAVRVTGDDTVVLARTINIVLNSQGAFSMLVPASEDPDISPNSWTWTLTDPDGNLYVFTTPVGGNIDVTDYLAVQDPNNGNLVTKGDKGDPGGTFALNSPEVAAQVRAIADPLYIYADLLRRNVDPVDLADSPYVEKYGAIGDGASHTLSSLGFSSLANAQAGTGGTLPSGKPAPAYPKATALSDEADWCAFANALGSGNRGAKIKSGSSYFVNRSVTVPGNRRLHADNPKQAAIIVASDAFIDNAYTGVMTNTGVRTYAPRVVELTGSQSFLAGVNVNASRVSYQFRGAWVSGRSYIKRDVVTNSGVNYQATGAFVSGATFAADGSNWQPYSGAAPVPALPGYFSAVDDVVTGWGDGDAFNDTAFNVTVRDVKTSRGRDGIINNSIETHCDNVLTQDAGRRGWNNQQYDLCALDISSNNSGTGFYDRGGSTTIFHGHMIGSVGAGWDVQCNNVFHFGCEADTSGTVGFRIGNGFGHKFIGGWGFQSNAEISQKGQGDVYSGDGQWNDWQIFAVTNSSWIGCNGSGAVNSPKGVAKSGWGFGANNNNNSMIGCQASGSLPIDGTPDGFRMIGCGGQLKKFSDPGYLTITTVVGVPGGTTYQATRWDNFIEADCTNGPVTITLADASHSTNDGTNEGAQVVIVKTDASANTATIQPTANNTMVGVTSPYVLVRRWDNWVGISDGVNSGAGNIGRWVVVSTRGGAGSVTPSRTALTSGESTIDRLDLNAATFNVPLGTEHWTYMTAAKSETITQVRFKVGTSLPTGVTLAKIGVYTVANNGDLTLIATATSTGMFNASGNATRNFDAPWTKLAGQRYAIAALAVGSSGNISFVGFSGQDAAEMGLPPRLVGRLAGQSDLAATATDASLASNVNMGYFALLP